MLEPVSTDGKFLQSSGERLRVKGVAYGTFLPNADGTQFPDIDRVRRDFDRIAALGANTVRTYTPPSPGIMDTAAERGLRVMVGVPWPQHIAFLDNRRLAREVRASVRDYISRLAAHPALLLFAVGNEIPPSVVRWYGRRRIESFLKELFDAGKSAAPEALLTYVNYPPTEYLEVPFFDVCAFNVFLHDERALAAYLARLQHIAGARPLLIAEAGADSLRRSEPRQAILVAQQLRTAFREGACGAIVFSWTDEWWRGGHAVNDWAFGLVDSARRPKLAYRTVQKVFQSVPFPPRQAASWPRVSVVVCAHNAASTMDECLSSLAKLSYPNYEVIVVNDGSTDATGAIASRCAGVRVVHTRNEGLSAARNTGCAHATGEIVAYTDADVRVDPDWLTYLVQPFLTTDVVAVGGPNVVPSDDPWIAHSVARAPGAPTHVLLDDRLAEHVPGCNCAFRRGALQAVDGFNPTFVRAGDDVDLCWRLHARGWRIGFAPAALVWHRHRSTIRGYLRQQVGYGEGETWLMHEHPNKLAKGRVTWRGHIYSPLPFVRSLSASRINAGPFGSAPFPSVYRTDAHPFAYLPHSGRWQISCIALLIAGAAALVTGHLTLAKVFGITALGGLVVTATKCLVYSLRSDLSRVPAVGRLPTRFSRTAYRLTIALLHFVQPFARLYGRIRGAMARPAGRRKGVEHPQVAEQQVALPFAELFRLSFGMSTQQAYWSERWIDVGHLLQAIADRLRHQLAIRRVESDDGWWEDRDVTITDGAGLQFDLRALIEEHADGKCLFRFALQQRFRLLMLLPCISGLTAAMALSGSIFRWPLALAVGLGLAGAAFARVASSARLIARTIAAVTNELGIVPVRTKAAPVACWPARDYVDGTSKPSVAAEATPARAPSPEYTHQVQARGADVGTARVFGGAPATLEMVLRTSRHPGRSKSSVPRAFSSDE